MLRHAPWLALFALASCKGCAGCQPTLNPDDNGEKKGDTEEPVDSAESEPPLDTAPPPPCALPEEEPNSPYDLALELEQELIACGYFSSGMDFEWMVFEEEDADWLLVDVRAESIGSAANVGFVISTEDFSEAVEVNGSRYSEDPVLTFPAMGAGRHYMYLFEEDQQGGEDYEWELMLSETKCPVEYNATATEVGDTPSVALELEDGDVYFGTFDYPDDYDWYVIHSPATKDKIDWTFTVEAYGSGSPANSRMSLWSADVLKTGTYEGGALENAVSDEDSYDLDPRLEHSITEEADLYLMVKESDGEGSAYYWYTLTASAQ